MRKLTHIKESCLYVKDLASAKQFYGEILELPLISYVEGRHVFFRIGQDVLLLFNAAVTKLEEELPPHFGQGNQHIAFECPLEAYESWKQYLIEKGIEIEHEAKWGSNYRSFYFRDYEENVLEIVQPGMWGG